VEGTTACQGAVESTASGTTAATITYIIIWRLDEEEHGRIHTGLTD